MIMYKKAYVFVAAILALSLSVATAQAQQRGGVLKFATPSVKPGLDPARTRTGDGYMLTAYCTYAKDYNTMRRKTVCTIVRHIVQ